jgi:uncharacterized protein
VIAFDTNILVYAHRRDSGFHEPAATTVRQHAESGKPWAIPAPCLHEFLAVVTHPRIYAPASTLADARAQVRAWLESPSLIVLAESEGYWLLLDELLAKANVSGPRIHDARVAALCLFHGVDKLFSADRDFGRFPELQVENPLVGR